MKLILSLQPGSKVNVPIELGEEELVSLTVADFKAKIMKMNSSKPADQLHVVFGSSILEDECLLTKYGIKDGDTVKYLFAEVRHGAK